MSILIKGVKMPIFEYQSWDIRKGADGKWYIVDTNAETSDGEWHEIVPILKHGRLIDADKIKGSIRKQTAFLRLVGGEFVEIAETLEKGFLQEIDNAPTIIEAEEGEG